MVSERGGCSFLFAQGVPGATLTPESISQSQQLIARAAREFVDHAIRPHIDQIETLDVKLTVRLLKDAGDLGLLGVDVPEQFGGLNLDLVTSMLVAAELARAGSFNVSFSGHTGIGTLPLVYFGTPAQKQKYLPGLASGRTLAAYALTEPSSGSDALAARTTARLSESGQQWILNGTKQWITNSGFADLFTLYAKVDSERFSAFLIERDTPGLSIGAEEHKMGLHGSSTCSVQLEDARIPRENLLGEVGRGHIIAFTILNLGRLKLAAGAVGACKHALALATRYAQERRQFGRAIIEFGLVRDKLAEMALQTYAAETMMLRTAGLMDASMATLDAAEDRGQAAGEVLSEYAVECAINKVLATEALDLVADEAVQIHGGNGFMDSYEISRIYRDARINRIFEGTNEINRLLITTQILRRIDRGSIALPATWGEDYPPRDAAQRPPWADILRWAASEAYEVALERFGSSLPEEQEVMGRLADLTIDLFTVDSAMLRAAAVAEAERPLHQDLSDLIAARAIARSESICRDLAEYLGDERVGAGLNVIVNRPAENAILIRRRIANAVVAGNHYPLGPRA
ncbi:MAG: acyl-CoA dehydrogenase family protein [Chloroflexota bacterium]